MGRARSIYFVADIHGSEVCWRKFLNAARYYDVDTVVVGGDVTGKALVPIIERDRGRFEANLGGRVHTASGDAGAAELAQRIGYNGFYPYRCSEGEYERLADDPAYRVDVFTGLMAETLRSWLRLADEKLAGSGIKAIVIPGNDDGWYVDGVLGESAQVVNADGGVVDLGELQVLGFGPSNRTPWNTTRELDEPDIAARLSQLEASVDRDKPLVAVTHAPPHGTRLDDAPKLRADLTVVASGGEPVMAPVGSTAVREFLERAQPVLSMHGHIHESRGIARLGRTVAINPGSAYSTAALQGAIATIKDGKVHEYPTGRRLGVLPHQVVDGYAAHRRLSGE